MFEFVFLLIGVDDGREVGPFRGAGAFETFEACQETLADDMAAPTSRSLSVAFAETLDKISHQTGENFPQEEIAYYAVWCEKAPQEAVS